jgi:hypothetical protein
MIIELITDNLTLSSSQSVMQITLCSTLSQHRVHLIIDYSADIVGKLRFILNKIPLCGFDNAIIALLSVIL